MVFRRKKKEPEIQEAKPIEKEPEQEQPVQMVVFEHACLVELQNIHLKLDKLLKAIEDED